jgi:hypothetical protein
MNWNRENALKNQKARTRDGRDVFNIREALLDGRSVLIGDVATIKRDSYKKVRIIPIESHYWEDGGLGRHSGDDLIDA